MYLDGFFFFFLQKVFIKCLSIKICIIYRFFFQENLIYDITASGGRAWFMLGGGWTTDLRYATENNTKEGWQLMMFKDEQWKCSKGSKKFQKSRKETPWVSPHWIWQKWQIYVRSNHRSIIQTGSGDWKKKNTSFSLCPSRGLDLFPPVFTVYVLDSFTTLFSPRWIGPRIPGCASVGFLKQGYTGHSSSN